MFMNRNVVKILGYGVDTFTFDEAVEYIYNRHGQIVTINPEMFQTANTNKDFSTIINNAEMVVPDGVGVQLGLKLLGHKVSRIAGIDLGKALLKKSAFDSKKVALIGAKPDVIVKTCEKLKEEIPQLNIVYSHDGYFKDSTEIINDVIKQNPDLILVALGSPKQEFFINELKGHLPNSIMIGLGGSFDVWSGTIQRAPEIYQKLGLEWLYRTIKEPTRFKRIFPTLPLFILKVIKERLSLNVIK